MSRIEEIVERCKAIGDTPEYRENAQRLTVEGAEFTAQSEERERRHRLIMSGVPADFWPLLDSPEPRPAVDAVRKLLDGPPGFRFLVLAGPKGRGKSFGLSVAVNEKGGRFVTAQELVTAGCLDRALWEDLAHAPILALDELGTEYLNPAYLSNLYELLNKRYSHNRKTVIATNLSAEPFRARYLSAGLDRLLDRLGTAGDWVNLPGDSMRQRWLNSAEEREP